MNWIRKILLSDNIKKILKNIYWALIGKIVSILNGLFIGIFIARYLGPDQYGLMNYITSLVGIFIVISAFGLDNILIREYSKKTDSSNVILNTSLIIRISFSLITTIGILIVCIVSSIEKEKFLLLMFSSFSIIASSFNTIKCYFVAIVENKYIVKNEISRTLIGALIKVIMIFLQVDLVWFIIAFSFDYILIAYGYYIAIKKKSLHINYKLYDRKLAKYLITQSFPLLLSGAAVIIYQKIDQVMIGNMLDNKSVGYFATANRIAELILFLPMIMVQTVAPILIRIKEKNEQLYAINKQVFVSIVVWVSIFISFVFYLTSYWLIKYSFGDEYILSVPILSILAWRTIGTALQASSGQLFIIEHIHKYAFIRNILGALICIGSNYILIPIYGALGSAYSAIITVFFTSFFANIFIPPYHKIMLIQLKALLLGWKDVIYIRRILL